VAAAVDGSAAVKTAAAATASKSIQDSSCLEGVLHLKRPFFFVRLSRYSSGGLPRNAFSRARLVLLCNLR
jgi:hypothetical protein